MGMSRIWPYGMGPARPRPINFDVGPLKSNGYGGLGSKMGLKFIKSFHYFLTRVSFAPVFLKLLKG